MTIRYSATWWLGWPALSTYAIMLNAMVGTIILLAGAILTARCK